MIPQIIGTKKSKQTRSVERFFKERSIRFQFVDITQRPLSPKELEAVAEAAGGVERLIDTGSPAYRKRNLAYLDFDPAEELAENPTLLISPIVRSDRGIAIQPDARRLAELLL